MPKSVIQHGNRHTTPGSVTVKQEPEEDLLYLALCPTQNLNTTEFLSHVKSEYIKSEASAVEGLVHGYAASGSVSVKTESDEDPLYSALCPTQRVNTGELLPHVKSEEDWIKNVKSEPGSDQNEQNMGTTVSPKKSRVKERPVKERRVNERYVCTQCGKCFSRADHLRIHNRIHTGEKPYRCTDCDKSFRRSGELDVHMRARHEGEKREKRYKCEECGKRFSASQHLKEHQMRHGGMKPYACSQCESSFTHPNDLVRHQRIHTGERPHLCTECGMAFRRLGTLKKHQKRKHTTLKPLACVHCKKPFRFEGHLQKHMRSHCKDIMRT